jgi:phage replication-related protein YjqB (UPF0714/DUF867 family)
VVAIHGKAGDDDVVLLGGRDKAVIKRLKESLRRNGFRVQTGGHSGLEGRSLNNLCNRGTQRAGVQLELSSALRRRFFRSLTSSGRQTRTQRFEQFVVAVRKAICDSDSNGPVEFSARGYKS